MENKLTTETAYFSMEVPQASLKSILTGKTTLPDGLVLIPFSYKLIEDTQRYIVFFFLETPGVIYA